MQHTTLSQHRVDASIENRARDIVLTHRRLFNRLDDLSFEYSHRTLTVRGELPTYYQKQLLQVALMQLENIVIDNRVTVRSA
jgi:hypothetical protein